MPGPIVVVNPNSTRAVTDGVAEAVAPLRMAGGPGIECVTLEAGPTGIETQAQADAVVGPLCDLIGSREETTSAFVIACYSDPGLHAARERTGRPVFGIGECAMLTALLRGERFGVISILAGSIPRHLRAIRSLGLASRFAGDLAIGLGVEEIAGGTGVVDRLVSVGRTLKDRHGADVLIVGCAGLARYRDALEDAVGLPVVEPTQAAVTLAVGAVRLGWDTGSRRR